MSVEALGGLGKTDFLNLLATQLQNQNPLNPMDNTAFIAQLAQFSALEAAENTNTEITKLSQQQSSLQAAAWLGKTVSGIDSYTQASFSGLVKAIDFSGSEPKLVINEKKYALTDVTKVEV